MNWACHRSNIKIIRTLLFYLHCWWQPPSYSHYISISFSSFSLINLSQRRNFCFTFILIWRRCFRLAHALIVLILIWIPRRWLFFISTRKILISMRRHITMNQVMIRHKYLLKGFGLFYWTLYQVLIIYWHSCMVMVIHLLIKRNSLVITFLI